MLRLALYDSCTLAADMASRPKLDRSPSTASSSSSMSRYIWRQRCDTTCSWFRRSATEARKDCCIWSSDTRVRRRRMACSTDSLDSYSDRLLCSVCTATHSWVNRLVLGHTRDLKFYQCIKISGLHLAEEGAKITTTCRTFSPYVYKFK